MPILPPRPEPVPLAVVRRLELVPSPAEAKTAPRSARAARPVVVPLPPRVCDGEAGSLRGQLAELKQELARLRG